MWRRECKERAGFSLVRVSVAIACAIAAIGLSGCSTASTATLDAVVEEEQGSIEGCVATFHNASEVDTSELPWGFTAGRIDLDDGTDVWLLTPGTSMTLEGASKIWLEYCIHPLAADASDGALLEVVSGDQKELLAVDDKWHAYQVDEEKETVEVSAVSQTNPDNDWIVIRRCTSPSPDSIESVGFSAQVQDAQEISTDQIPWGFTAGEIVMEDGSEAWLLTPNTSLKLKGAQGRVFQYCVHPWVASLGDGAQIALKSDSGEQQFRAETDWQELTLGDSDEAVIACLSEDNNDGDWVVLRLLS